MSNGADPGFWKEVSTWLWTVLVPFFAILWKKADNAAPRDEVAMYVKERRDQYGQMQETMRELFRNAEEDRRRMHEALDTLSKNMHAMHIDLLDKIARK